MAIGVEARTVTAERVYQVRVTLRTRIEIPDPETFVLTDETVREETLARAGLPATTVFVSAVLLQKGYIGSDIFYELLLTFEQIPASTQGHTHDTETLNVPLRDAYRDGPYIDLDSTLGPVSVYATPGDVDYLRIHDGEGTNYFFLDKDTNLTLGSNIKFTTDTVYDIGTVDGVQFFRPRDVYVGRDLYAARDVLFGDLARGATYEFVPGEPNPHLDAGTRLLYWNPTDNKLHVWDGAVDLPLGGAGSIPTWDAIYAVDQDLELTSNQLKFYTTTASIDSKFLVQRTAGVGGALQVATTVGSGDALWVDAEGGLGIDIVQQTGGTALRVRFGDVRTGAPVTTVEFDAKGPLRITTESTAYEPALHLTQQSSGWPFLRLIGDKGAGTAQSISEDSEPDAVMLKVAAGTTSAEGTYWIPAYTSTTIPTGAVTNHELDPIAGPHTGTLLLNGDTTGPHNTNTVTKIQNVAVQTLPVPTNGQILQMGGPPPYLWTYKSFGGDISAASVNSATVVGIQGRPVNSTAPLLNQVLGWTGSAWAPQTVSGGGGGTVIGTYNGTVSVKDAVYVSSTDTVSSAAAGSDAPVIGIVISIPSPGTAEVQLAGEVGVFTALTPGATYFLSTTSGAMTTSVAGFSTGDTIQRVGVAKNATTLVLNQQIIATL